MGKANEDQQMTGPQNTFNNGPTQNGMGGAPMAQNFNQAGAPVATNFQNGGAPMATNFAQNGNQPP